MMPNTLAQLNAYANIPLQYNDNGTYSITFSPSSPVNQSVTVAEDQVHAAAVGINITALASTPRNIIYSIDGSSVGNTFLCSWSSDELPSGVTYTNPSAGVHTLTGVNGVGLWNILKSPNVVAKDRTSNYSYTSTITYPDFANVSANATKVWTSNVTISSSAAEMTDPVNQTWGGDLTVAVAGYPQITDLAPFGGTYTMEFYTTTANMISNMSVSSLEGSWNYNADTQKLTVTGTKDQVNAAIATITMTPKVSTVQSATFTWRLTNPFSGLQTSKGQAWTVSRYSLQTSLTFDEDALFRIYASGNVAGNVITDPDPSAYDYTKRLYRITITQSGPSSWNPGTGIMFGMGNNRASFYKEFGSGLTTDPIWPNEITVGYTTGGNVDMNSSTGYYGASYLNDAFKNNGIWALPPADWTTNPLSMSFRLDKYNIEAGTIVTLANAVPFTLTYSGNSSVAYSAIGNVSGTQLVPLRFGAQTGNTFQITDRDPLGVKTYTLSMSVSDHGNIQNGNLSLGGSQGNSLTFTNYTKTQINDAFSANVATGLRWLPGYGNATGNLTLSLQRTFPDNKSLGSSIVAGTFGNVSQGTAVDGGTYVGLMNSSVGFPNPGYHLIVRQAYTSTVQFLNRPSQPVIWNTNDSYDGLTNQETLKANIAPTSFDSYGFQAFAIADTFTGGNYAHDDWYVASEKEAEQIINRLRGTSDVISDVYYWTSTIVKTGSINQVRRAYSGNPATFDSVNMPTGATQYRVFIVRRIPA